MKVISRIVTVAVSFVMLAVAFTACSVEKDILGDWTVSTIDGKTCEEYAAALGVAPSQVAINLKLESDKATLTGVKGSQEFQVSYKSNGVELMSNGAIAGSIAYDKTAQTLSMKDNSTGAIVEYVFKKGTTDLTVPETTEATVPEETSDNGDSDELTGADYGERSEEEMAQDGLTGADYGERSAEEMAEDDAYYAQQQNQNRSNNNSGSSTNKKNLTGADYGERSAEEMAEDYGYYGERTSEEMAEDYGYYGERTAEEMAQDGN